MSTARKTNKLRPAKRGTHCVQRMVRAHRGTRCGFCYWALYDGEWCQNSECEWRGKEPPEKVKLTNAEAAILIEAMRPNSKVSDGGGL